MANVLFTDYRPFGAFALSPTPVAVAEGDAEVVYLAADLTGIPNGVYEIHQTILFKQIAGKFMNFRLIFNDDDSGEAACVESAGETGCLTASSGSIIFQVTDGTMKIEAGVEFPTQGGGGSADGSIETLLIWWKRLV